jgi:hypothetical protein
MKNNVVELHQHNLVILGYYRRVFIKMDSNDIKIHSLSS